MTFNTFAEKHLCSYNFLLADGGDISLDSTCSRTLSPLLPVIHGRDSAWLNIKKMRISLLRSEEGV